MNSVVGEILPLALGVAISPIPIIAAILMLLSPKARGTNLGFLTGWLLGIIVAVVVFTLLAAVIPAGSDGSKPVAGVIKIVLGALLLLLAIRQWRSRPHGDTEPALPKWMSAIDTMTPVRGLVLGFLLSGLNPKNLLMGVAAGVAIGSGGLTVGSDVVAIVIFTVIAASTVAVPVFGYLVASTRLAGPLEALRTWLVHNNSTVMAVLLLVIGVVMIGKGIGSF
ncbi:GAP family protein [Subtercola sp. YIM 133946]|uniref:GAP family protein n=1 Tax=Subtercola sp. YIM 133946 TaxID=3118909 RepID=UPI002F956B7F